MDSTRRNAMMFTGLVLIFSGWQLMRFENPAAITTLNSIISVLLPIIAIVFCLNVMEKKWRYGLMAINFLALFLMGSLAFMAL